MKRSWKNHLLSENCLTEFGLLGLPGPGYAMNCLATSIHKVHQIRLPEKMKANLKMLKYQFKIFHIKNLKNLR